jgi:glycosyltransferase involved in cell wall biosynthesis
MKQVLFVHNNFPGQFIHLARALSHFPEVRVAAIGSPTAKSVPGVELSKYTFRDVNVSATHPFARRLDMECRRAEQVLYTTSALTHSDFTPDIVFAHPGWGETLPLRAIFPQARIIVYCEFYYRAAGEDFGFDPEFPETGIDGHVRLHIKNAATLLALAECDAAVSPTHWQRSTFPEEYREKIAVLHEGVDVEAAKPDPNATFRLPSGRTLTRNDEIVTFVARCLEPLRGIHIFTRALPQILAERPNAEILIIGGESKPYGFSPPPGTTWQSHFLAEVADRIDPSRLHFVGHLSHPNYIRALQVSSAHVYLTYPFVLSWSLLEAMSAGCVVVGSDTAPVREVINGQNGLLVPFFDFKELAHTIIDVLAQPQRYEQHRLRARETVLAHYDAKRICVPQMLSYLEIPQTQQPKASRLEFESEQA